MSVVLFAAVSASALNRGKFAHQPREQKMTQKVGASIFLNPLQPTTYLLPDRKQVKANYSTARGARKLAAAPNLVSCYSEWTATYVEGMGFFTSIMYDGASFEVTPDGKAYFAPYSRFGYVEGVVEKDVENSYSSDGADSITFSVGAIAAYTDPETQERTSLYLEPCNVVNYAPVRAGQKTFGAYYFAEAEELYIPSSVTLALFEADETVTEPFTSDFVWRALDLIPKEIMDPYISKATVSGKSYYGEDYNFEHSEAMAYVGSEQYVLISGISSADENAWAQLVYDENDETKLHLEQDQLFAVYNFYTDETRTDTYVGAVSSAGLLQTDGQLTKFNSDNEYRSTYQWTDNADETATLTNTDGTVSGEYIYASAEGKGGMYNAVDLTINIAFDPIATTETGINGVGATGKVSRDNAIYNIAGQRVDSDYKGLVVKNGKKILQK